MDYSFQIEQPINLQNKSNFLYHLLFHPGKVIKHIINAEENIHFGLSIIIFIFGLLLNMLSHAILHQNRPLFTHSLGLSGFLTIINFCGNVIIYSSIIFFFRNFSVKKNELVSSKNNGLVFLKLLFFSFIPLFFTPALSLLGLFFKISGIPGMYNLIKFGLYFWIIYLQIMIIKNIFQITLASAIGLYFLPMIAFFTLILITILRIGLTIIPSII